MPRFWSSVLIFCAVDVNECIDPNLCAYGTCHNTHGGYSCRCEDGTERAHCYRGNNIYSIALVIVVDKYRKTNKNKEMC